MRNDLPSQTALGICVSHFVLQHDERFKNLMAKEFGRVASEVMRQFKPAAYYALGLLRRIPGMIDLMARLQDRYITPGISAHFVVRKKAIHDCFETIINKEKDIQIVSLASGYDTLTWRLAKKYPELHFFETDHPATQKPKVKIYEKLNLHAANNILVSCDYTQTNIQTVLSKHPLFRSDRTTLFLAEGLMMYLPFDLFIELLKSMKTMINGKTFIIFTYLQNFKKGGTPGFKNQNPWLDWFLAKSSEPLMWGRDPNDLKEELMNIGFKVEQDLDYHYFRKNYLDDHKISLAHGENICVISSQG